jgi:diguanylate cyclase (GGDEF)-like protein/PAS domain S-box-containing protein
MSQAELFILIVEDEATEAEIVARELARAGISCRFRRVDTEAAFNDGLGASPDLIISDFQMPHFDGMSALKIARAKAADTPFILFSGTLGEERAIDALKNGATDYVLKSNLSRLVPAVRRALQDVAATRASRQAEQRFRDLVQTSQDWIWEQDADGYYRFNSPGVEAVLGIPPESLLGLHHSHRVHIDDQILLSGAMRLLGPAENSPCRLTLRWQHADGSYRWLERYALAVMDERGVVIGYRGTDRDITERKQREEKSHRLTGIYRVLNSVNAAVLRIRDRAELLEEVCRIAAAQGDYALATALLTDAGNAVLRPVAATGIGSEDFRHFTVPIGAAPARYASLAEKALATGQPAVCNDLTNPDTTVFFVERLVACGLRAGISLPLSVADTVMGTLNLFSMQAGIFESEEIALWGQLAGTLSFALQYLEKEGQANFLAYFDPVTGLARRPLFSERLARSLPGRPEDSPDLEVHVLDLQSLAAINDRFGRQAGDKLLQLVAERLKGVFRDPVQLAYFGSGTFGVVGAAVAAATHDSVPTALVRALDQPFQLEGQDVNVSAWVGAARYPADAQNAEVLLQNAEHALKRAKETGEHYLAFARGMNEGMYTRMTLEHQLRCAAEHRQFVLHYQPKVDLQTGRVVGAEALLRWQHPTRGLVPPGEFIPVLEDSGLVVEVGKWVIEEAVRAGCAWAERGLSGAPIAVNVSPVQLQRRDFVDFVLAAVGPLQRCGGRLELEITEGALIEDWEGSTAKLSRLADAGLKIAIDDFGTGYSSLGRLARLPVHALKIDRTFIADITTSTVQATLVATIVSLARAFALCAIAEGVETQEQRELLRGLQCDQYQGYLFAKPMAEADFVRLLAAASRGEPGPSPAARRGGGGVLAAQRDAHPHGLDPALGRGHTRASRRGRKP